jgi:ammonia channel protein AmtB
VDDVVGAVAVHGVSGFLGVLWVGVFAAGYPTGVNNVDSSIGGQLIGMATFLPLGFLSGWVASLILRKLNLLRVPPEVELAGLDTVEYAPDIYLPEVVHRPEQLVEPDGTVVDAQEIILREALEIVGDGRDPATRVR